jgi:hypothetical protein
MDNWQIDREWNLYGFLLGLDKISKYYFFIFSCL